MAAPHAREMWHLLEPYHAVVYFDPQARAIYEEVGLKGYWMGYFASRAAALGAPAPEVVIATFYNFAPRMVRRAIPDAWSFSIPRDVLAARYRLADVAVRRALAGAVGSRDLERAATLLRELVPKCDPVGRPLYAAHAALPWPTEPHLILWHAATLWREFRGDGHVAALLVHGIDGCEANVLAHAAGATPGQQREYRGWSEEEWADATRRLRYAGLVTESGGLTPDGSALRERVEAVTDELSSRPLNSVRPEILEHLRVLLMPICQQILHSGAIPYPNAMGLTARGVDPVA